MSDSLIFAIDLKSFYASVECSLRGLDPLKTNLVVADVSRTDKTICLAVSPSLKSLKVPGRPRLFEVRSILKKINSDRLKKTKNNKFSGKSIFIDELNKDFNLEVDLIIATPQMKKYIEFSNTIYKIYLKYFSKEDIHVYSVDEVFIDATKYLKIYKEKPEDLARKIVREILEKTHITATVGIGSNLYLSKIAMDIIAKHEEADMYGCRIARLDTLSYRKLLWNHTPLTDFWRVGAGISNRLSKLGLKTMGDIALCSIENEDILFKNFGVNAEILIDHAWGYESVSIKDIKNYKSIDKSISKGQVLSCGYKYESALIILKEMAYDLVLTLFDKNLKTNQIVINIFYDEFEGYSGDLVYDHYGRVVPKPSHGSINIDTTFNSDIIVKNSVILFNNIIDKSLLVRKINIAFRVVDYSNMLYEQLDLFNIDNKVSDIKNENTIKTINMIKKKYGKNAILKGIDLEEDATQIKRNSEIGGHKA